ncbi:MAG: alpha/beta hydrolase [Pseudomonadota bacterium]
MTETLDPHAGRFLDMLALKGGEAARLGIAERRAAFANLMRFGGSGPDGVGVETVHANRPIRLYRPMAASATGIVFFHGGGLVAGSLDTHDSLCRMLAAASGCNIFSVDYRLAPEHPFPTGLEDASKSLRWVFEKATAYGLDRVGIGGDSAGGTLAAITAAQWPADALKPLAFQLLLCPILDFAGEMPSRRAFPSAILDQATLDHDIALYTADAVARDDPKISPLRAAQFAGLPPTFLHMAQCDPLRDEEAAYAERLRGAGVELHETYHAGMPHLFYAFSGVIPAAKAAVTTIGAELADWLKQS